MRRRKGAKSTGRPEKTTLNRDGDGVRGLKMSTSRRRGE